VNTNDIRDLLHRAADSVTPAETDPATRMVALGRRSVQRRRAWGAAGFVAAAVAAVIGVPLAMGIPKQSEVPTETGGTVSFGGLTVAVPEGWPTERVRYFDPCTADPHTVYLAEALESWQPNQPRPLDSLAKCESDGQEWMAVVKQGAFRYLTPQRLVTKDRQPLQVRQYDMNDPFVWDYRAINDQVWATTAYISGDEKVREQLLERVTWPSGPPAPPSGGLVLPDRITSATGEAPNVISAMDTKTLNQIRTILAGLRDPVPAGEECILQTPGVIAIDLGAGTDRLTVVLGNATCPQAVSTGGGRVKVPAGLGQQLLDLIEASDRAAAKRIPGTKD
jgi:hypothetical protein